MASIGLRKRPIASNGYMVEQLAIYRTIAATD